MFFLTPTFHISLPIQQQRQQSETSRRNNDIINHLYSTPIVSYDRESMPTRARTDWFIHIHYYWKERLGRDVIISWIFCEVSILLKGLFVWGNSILCKTGYSIGGVYRRLKQTIALGSIQYNPRSIKLSIPLGS